MPELANHAAAHFEIKVGRCIWAGIEPELGFIRFSLSRIFGRNVPACVWGKLSGMRHASGLHVMPHVIVTELRCYYYYYNTVRKYCASDSRPSITSIDDLHAEWLQLNRHALCYVLD